MILDIEKLSVKYKGAAEEAVKELSLSLPENSFSALIGESGSGKSTVLMTLLGLLPNGSEARGEILYRGEKILNSGEEKLSGLRQREIALIPQGALNSFTPVMTIGRHLRELLEIHLNISGAEAEKRIKELLAEAELPPETAGRYPHELSGGQKQRAAIALALSCDPKLVLADEPTTALDVVTQAAVIRLMQRLRREKNLTILLVTHDLPLAASACDQLFVMKNGRLIESGAPKTLITSPREPHTKALIAAML
ncbi:MAG: ABC transporter ATP-binding protein [Synergistaceae bacterium]|nr:ABC transporter ATP-binding protein [Synergistaceae bacterium]